MAKLHRSGCPSPLGHTSEHSMLQRLGIKLQDFVFPSGFHPSFLYTSPSTSEWGYSLGPAYSGQTPLYIVAICHFLSGFTEVQVRDFLEIPNFAFWTM